MNYTLTPQPHTSRRIVFLGASVLGSLALAFGIYLGYYYAIVNILMKAN